MADRIIIGAPEQQSTTQQQSQIRESSSNKTSVVLGNESGLLSPGYDQSHSVTSAPTTDGSPLSTIRTKAGVPVGADMSNVTNDSTIAIGGVEMSISEGLHSGMLTKTSSGELQLTEAAEQFHSRRTEASEAAEVEAKESEIFMDEGMSQDVQGLAARVGGPGLCAAVADAAAAALDGDDTRYDKVCSDLQQCAQSSGGVHEFMTNYLNSLNTAAINAVEARGIDGGEFMEWIQKHHSTREVARLLVSGVHMADKTAMDYIVEKFKNRSQAKVQR